jgi:ankyrin repeat protein
MRAALKGHEPCVQALLRAKANTELLDEVGDTAVQYAEEEQGHTAIAQLLRQHAATPEQVAQAARAARAARAAKAAQAARADAAMETLLAEEAAEQAKAQARSKKSKKKNSVEADGGGAGVLSPGGVVPRAAVWSG